MRTQSWSIWWRLIFWAFLLSAVQYYSVITQLPLPTAVEVKAVQVFLYRSQTFRQFSAPGFRMFSCCQFAGGWVARFVQCFCTVTEVRFFLPFFSPLWIFMDGICQDLRGSDPLNKVLVRLSIRICAEVAKPCLGAFPYFIRIDTNVHCFTAWLISSKISRFFTSFWQWEAGRRAFNWTYITKTLHLRLLYIGMENWLQTFQSYNEQKVRYMTQCTTSSLCLVGCFTFITYVITFAMLEHTLHARI